jgi:3-isopropylmalate/(R)-2-methylmalate dehydratase small subunit
MTIRGTAWRLGDNVSTDEILPGRYMGLEEGAELGRHALAGIAPDVTARMEPGDILVAGANFGTGSSRESAPRALRAAGFGAIIAESYARIFYRNCINIGLVALWCDGVAGAVSSGATVRVSEDGRTLHDDTTGVALPIEPLSPFAQRIVDAGGLVPLARARLGGSLVETEGGVA